MDNGITLGMIVKNESANLKRIQEKMHPLDVVQDVVITDTGSTDDTVAVAEGFGWRVTHYPWHDDFGAARTDNMAACNTRWYLWMDADDLVVNFESLPTIAAEMDGKQAWAIFPYIYEHDAEERAVMVQRRERLIDMQWPGLTWRWDGVVHETLLPSHPVPNSERTDVVWHHWPDKEHRNSARRNLEILRKLLTNDKVDARTVFYMGTQYMALSEWAQAARWFRKYLEVGVWPEEMWRAAIFECDALFHLAQAAEGEKREAFVQEAANACHVALDLKPEWMDGYLHLARAYFYMGDFEKCIHWHEIGLTMQKPDSILFSFEREYDYNPYLYSYRARWKLGDVAGALADAETALKVAQPEQLLADREMLEGLCEQEACAEAGIALAQFLPKDKLLDLAELLPAPVRMFKDVQEQVYGPVALLHDKGTQPRVDFFCGESLEPWGPPSINHGGIGGSETAVVQVARLLSDKGIQVRVLGKPGPYAGIHHGVEYWDFNTLPRGSRRDMLVYWRNPLAVDAGLVARRTLLWCHDLHYGKHIYGPLPFDYVAGVSDWHKKYLATTYPAARDKLVVLRNGIDLGRYGQNIERDPHYIIWSSSPDRGLPYLLAMMPYLRALDPDIKMHAFYGLQNLEKMARGDKNAAATLAALRGMIDQNKDVLEWHGRVSQQELALAQQKATWWIYPTTFTEVSCITALEAQAAHLRIIASDVAALPGTINGGGYCIPGSARHEMTQQRFVGMWAYWLQHPDEVGTDAVRWKQDENVNNQTWEQVVSDDWMPLVTEAVS